MFTESEKIYNDPLYGMHNVAGTFWSSFLHLFFIFGEAFDVRELWIYRDSRGEKEEAPGKECFMNELII